MTNISASGEHAHVVMPEVHGVSSLLKRWLLGTHQGAVSHDQLYYYLDEFTFRFNRRRSHHRGLLFCRLLEGAVATARSAAPAAAPGRALAPPAHAPFSYQIGGAFSPQPGVVIVDRDRQAPPVAGLYNICYVNAFQAQVEERRWWLAHHRGLLLYRRGHAIIDRSWQEQLLDTSTVAKRRALARIVGAWFAGCARAGFQAVEPDNLDSWGRSQGALTVHHNLAYAALLIARAHALHLAIVQENAAELASAGRRLGFDFAIAEECQTYGECSAYLHAYGRGVIEIEYADNEGRRSDCAEAVITGDLGRQARAGGPDRADLPATRIRFGARVPGRTGDRTCSDPTGHPAMRLRWVGVRRQAMRGAWCWRKNRIISAEESGPCASV